MSEVNSDQENKPFLEFNFKEGNGGSLKFSGRSELFVWLEAETHFWSWLLDATNMKDENLLSLARDWRKAFNNLKALLSNAGGRPETLDKEQVTIQVQALITYGFFHSDTVKAKFIKAINDTKSTHAAYAALAFVRRQSIDMANPDNFAGILKYNLMAEGIDAESPNALMSAFENNQKNALTKVSSLTKSADAIIQDVTTKQKELYGNVELLKRWGRLNWHRYKLTLQTNLDEEVEKLHGVKKTYTEFMNLSAPVDYWIIKAKEHKTKSKTLGIALIIYALFATSAFTVGSAIAWSHIKDAGKESYALLALLVFLSTIVLWAGRLLVRLYLSDVHLAIDANQRATMVKTYLALINDNKLEKTERELVLRPLFAPTSDGIVKDDAAPILSPAAYISGKM